MNRCFLRNARRILTECMASNATIYKAALRIADLDRQYFQDHTLTLARHPSETEERLMVRMLAFALHADEALSFGRGIGTEDEPALWQRDATGTIDLWIEIGQPDEKTLRQACGRAKQVIEIGRASCRERVFRAV